MTTYFTNSEKQTIKLGKKLSAKFFAGLIVVLNGDLGAGKTAITKGFAKGLKIKESVTSPTFTIMNEYFSGKLPMYHFDMYRLEDDSEAYEIGLNEYFNKSDNVKPGVAVIEWAEKIANLIPAKHLTINITKLGENKRKIDVEESL
ncbi:MAG: tRNA (adenosine(37)-N6)-threonylcarbamoyltransferase complex ATPase subunit type 1 TsaE [Spirochaetales bacterium]